MIKVKINGNEYEYKYGTSFSDIISDVYGDDAWKVLLVSCDGTVYELHKILKRDCTIDPITAACESGHYTYERSALFILLKAIHDCYPHLDMDTVIVEFSIANGLYIRVGDSPAEQGFISRVRERMHEIAESGIPIVKKNVSTETAIETFDMLEMRDKVKLFRYRRSSRANLYYIDSFTDYFYGYMVQNTGYIRYFDLIPYEGGMVLLIPTVNSPYEIEAFEPNIRLFRQLRDHEDYMNSVGVSNVADINTCISSGKITNVVLTQEASMEKRIGDIAQTVLSDPRKKIILIAGPSSSGKTTFSHRLSIQLESLGVITHPIASDNYYVNRDATPVDKDGNPDFECLEAMDIAQFSFDMLALLEGKAVEIPSYNFKLGRREYNGDMLKLSEKDILVIEGIHCLDDAMVGALPKENVYKIFIGPLSQLNLDDHNLFDPNDGRLLRRIIRDNRTRGVSAAQSIAMWPSVRRGEELYIYPFRKNADVIFNSSLVYETCVIKPYAEALLFAIRKEHPSYVEANRLLKILDYFLTIPADSVPKNSLLREFIGGNIFNV